MNGLVNELKVDKKKAKASGLPNKPVSAIRQFCIECVGDGGRKRASKLVRECPAVKCPLYPFRLGKNPYHKLNLTSEQRKLRSDLAKDRFIGKSASFESKKI